MKAKRTNKTKEELVEEVRKAAAVNHQIELAKKIYPLIQDQKSIYDAQTALNAAAGYIQFGVNKRMKDISLSDVMPDILEALTKEKKSAIKTSVEEIIQLLTKEKTEGMVALLQRFGKTLGEYSSTRYMKNPMSVIKLKDIIS